MKKEKIEDGVLETWDVKEVAEAMERGEIVLIDVRSPAEYMMEHIEGALLMPLSFFDAKMLPTQDGKRLVFHCGSGVRSEKAARQALAEGLSPIAHLGGGFAAWKAEGRPFRATDMATGGPKKVPAR